MPGPRRGLRRLRVFDRSYAQVEQYARDWAASNERALQQDGPLWVVLGDSAAQGVGADAFDRGWVGQVLPHLGPGWRVVNLSVSGARTADVVRDQVPALRRLGPADLITAVVGGNDALGTPLARWVADVDALLDALPAGAVVSTTARGVLERRTRRANAHVRAAAPARGLRVADVWAHTGPPYRGLYADGFHPNARGYAQWATAVLEALESPPP